ncbi:copper resistance CopC family protein [Pseudonocardia humida]|uniref:Copper resistance protein CopC n=1 Tax=Pseudonocardia humida TaxID=2800819 RepID=A0ABT1A4Q7_9PSEU|nr:copper resistance CopC family protein [Pseudonocardia humida]MCO1658000.1 copper resistance protein CopC [Pseudonocardia humida]
MTRQLLRTAAVTLLCGLALLLGTAPAFAHTRLESSDPADGSSVDAAPQRVSLTFNESVPAEFSQVTVVGPDGTNYQTGTVTSADGVVSTAVLPLGPAGRYEIGYRVVSDDGHPVTGSVAFTLTAAATPSPAAAAPSASAAAPAPAPTPPSAAAAQPDDGGSPVWPWIVGAVVLVGGGVVAALRLGRSG